MSFFKIHKPLKYRYRPIYYDPKKETQKEREKQAAQENEGSKEIYQPKILKRGSFREIHEKNNKSARAQNRQSNIRLIIIILFLFLIAYFLMR